MHNSATAACRKRCAVRSGAEEGERFWLCMERECIPAARKAEEKVQPNFHIADLLC